MSIERIPLINLLYTSTVIAVFSHARTHLTKSRTWLFFLLPFARFITYMICRKSKSVVRKAFLFCSVAWNPVCDFPLLPMEFAMTQFINMAYKPYLYLWF